LLLLDQEMEKNTVGVTV